MNPRPGSIRILAKAISIIGAAAIGLSASDALPPAVSAGPAPLTVDLPGEPAREKLHMILDRMEAGQRRESIPAGSVPVVQRWPDRSIEGPRMFVNLPDNQFALAGQLTHNIDERHLLLTEVIAIMNEEHCLDADLRAATLQILADSGQLAYLGTVTDRNSRAGHAFGMHSRDQRGRSILDILIFNEDTGALLGYERQAESRVLSQVVYICCSPSTEVGHDVPAGQ